jgi:lipopolysaccharide export system ATP-binding protein
MTADGSPNGGGGALEAVGLEKTFRRRRVVKGVSLSIRPGEVVGLLGPNGAGKTTIFNMIVGLTPRTAGDRPRRAADHQTSHVPSPKQDQLSDAEASVFES